MDKIITRLKEPSTGAGLAVLFSFFLPQAAPIIPDFVASLGQVAGFGAALFAIIKQEKSS